MTPTPGTPSLHEVKQYLQRLLRPGIVVVIGSGLSCSEGLPGMPALATHLASCDITTAALSIAVADWNQLTEAIRREGLEAALHGTPIEEDVSDYIRTATAQLYLQEERLVIEKVLSGTKTLGLSRLMAHLPQDNRFTIVTTNYDRLIELACEVCGFKVDTKAVGQYHGHFSKTEGAYAYASSIEQINKSFKKVERKVVSLYKPHGSLDWSLANGVAIRTFFPLEPQRTLIITPGQNKYRAGYDEPFAMHRELANASIGRAESILVIGYGFNDGHLETSLKAKIAQGAETLIMAKTLTENARQLVADSLKVWALEQNRTDPNSTTVHIGKRQVSFDNTRLWDVHGFCQEVMGS